MKETDAKDDEMGGAIAVLAGGGQSVKPYRGEFNLWLTPDEEFVLTSQKSLPGIQVYDDGDEVVTYSKYRDTPIGAGSLASELPKLANLREMKRWIRRAKSIEIVKKATEENGGDATYRFEIPRRIISANKADGGLHGLLAGMQLTKIMRIYADVSLNGEGALTDISFSIVRSSLESRMSVIRLNIGAGGAVEEEEEDKKKEKLKEGKTITYKLAVSDKGPSESMKAFLESVQKDLEE